MVAVGKLTPSHAKVKLLPPGLPEGAEEVFGGGGALPLQIPVKEMIEPMEM